MAFADIEKDTKIRPSLVSEFKLNRGLYPQHIFGPRPVLPKPGEVKRPVRPVLWEERSPFGDYKAPLRPVGVPRDTFGNIGGLPTPIFGEDDHDGGLGWSLKRFIQTVKEVVKHPLRQPLKTLAVLTPVTAPAFGLKPETRGRIQRRVGGAITGAVTGFVTGGPVGAVVGAGTGMAMAKKGTKGLKGYGKIALVGGAAGGAAAALTGAGAQFAYSSGFVSQQTAQSAILASGKAGMFGMSMGAGAPIGAAAKTAMAVIPLTGLFRGAAPAPVIGDQTVATYSESMPQSPFSEPIAMTPSAPAPQQSWSDYIQSLAVSGLTAPGQRPPSTVTSGYDFISTEDIYPRSVGGELAPVQEAGIVPSEGLKNVLLIGGGGLLLYMMFGQGEKSYA